uniref:Death-associated protein 1 n=1 Tax=Cacopsylla melanoneura TaxID=428564 RepID=A0A8D8UJB2_9HEMI
MSDDKELKGGHAPAVKAGGMRITQNKTSHDKSTSGSDEPTNQALKVSTSPPKTTAIAGAPIRGHADYPPEAVQSFHDKPSPAHQEKSHQNKPTMIQQPRK